jgi:hypothetical protein
MGYPRWSSVWFEGLLFLRVLWAIVLYGTLKNFAAVFMSKDSSFGSWAGSFRSDLQGEMPIVLMISEAKALASNGGTLFPICRKPCHFVT